MGAHVISIYSGMPYPEFIHKRVLNVLNMSSTTFSAKKASMRGSLTQSWTTSGRRIPFWSDDELLDLNAGAGGIISNVFDMVGADTL